jgi:hypothetical protein
MLTADMKARTLHLSELLQSFKMKVMNFCMVGQKMRCRSTFTVLRKNYSRFSSKVIYYNQQIMKFMP